MTARGADYGLTATSTFTDVLITVIDDGGPDDLNASQKDLTFLQLDYAPSVPDIAVVWGWDDTQWSGANTGDACTLFDTNSNGHANYSICIAVEPAGLCWLPGL